MRILPTPKADGASSLNRAMRRSANDAVTEEVLEILGSKDPQKRRIGWKLVTKLLSEDKAPLFLIWNEKFAEALQRDEASPTKNVRVAAQDLREKIKRTYGALFTDLKTG